MISADKRLVKASVCCNRNLEVSALYSGGGGSVLLAIQWHTCKSWFPGKVDYLVNGLTLT